MELLSLNLKLTEVVNIGLNSNMKNLINKYSLKGRLLPTILCAIPFLIFQYSFLSSEQIEFLKELGAIKFVGDVTITVAIIYFLMQVNRFLSKHTFEAIYFKKQLYFPTTSRLLLSDNSLSSDYKNRIREKAELEFNINFLKSVEETENELTARKTIRDIVGLIRRKVGDGTLTLQHNIEYGFFRNLIGGSTISFLMACTLIYLSIENGNRFILGISIILTTIYLALILLSKKILFAKGGLYCDILFQDYMTN